MIKIDGLPIEATFVEYGVQWEDGEVTEMEMTEAFAARSLGTGAKVLARRVFETAWAEVTP